MHKASPIIVAIFAISCGNSPSDATPDADLASGLPNAGDDGASCLSAADCFGGTCLSELETGLPNGYCTSFGCEATGCHGGQCVIDSAGTTACVDDCLSNDDCRVGYECVTRGAIRICDADAEPVTEVGESPNGVCISGCEVGDAVRIDCGFTPSRELQPGVMQWGLPYQTTSGVHGFVLSVWAEGDPSSINAISIRNRDDQYLALKAEDSALNVTSFVENELVALMFPFAREYTDFARVDGGLLQVQAEAESLCIARAEGLEGDELAIHLYLVGASGLTRDSIEIDPDVRKMLVELQRLLSLAGITVKSIVAHDAPESVTQQYRIIRDQDDLHDVLAITYKPLDDEEVQHDDALVLNIVMVDDITFNDGTDTVGQAGLVPGPAGLHGIRSGGVVIETTSLREAPEYLALIAVHETAHFMGLRHTSEVFNETYAFGRTDPLQDTPECPDVGALMEACPDYENLMFPIAPAARTQSRVILSDDQGWVLRNSPLVR